MDEGNYICSRCKAKVRENRISNYIFYSTDKHHTLLSTQMCLDCRDEVFDFIEEKTIPEEPLAKLNRELCGKVLR